MQLKLTNLPSCSGRCAFRRTAPPRRCVLRHSNIEKSLMGENFGARDPTPGEIATNFADTGMTHYDTAHIIKPPENIGQFLGLTVRRCQDNKDADLISGTQLDLLRQQVPGWRITTSAAGHQCIQQEWKAKDAASAEQLSTLVKQVAEQEGHPVALKTAGEVVSAELCTAARGGLTINDFIVAAKVNNIRTVDLLPQKKKRFWA